jgi:hypothetical protein
MGTKDRSKEGLTIVDQVSLIWIDPVDLFELGAGVVHDMAVVAVS